MFIIAILIAILAFGILIFVHELGHFVMAKLNKIGVDEFSIGFGKEVAGFQRGETHYSIRIFPMGGYCKMRGEESRDRDSETEPDPKAMYNRPPLARLITVAGGPVFNYIFAVILLVVLFAVGFREELITSDVEVTQTVSGKTTPAWEAGIRSGDKIISLDGKKITTYTDILQNVALNIDKKMNITYVHQNTTNTSEIIPWYDNASGIGDIGASPLTTTEVLDISTNSPAQTAGLIPGDVIAAINGASLSYHYELVNFLQDKANQEVELTIKRSNETILKKVTLGRFEGKGYLGIRMGDSPRISRWTQASNIIEAAGLAIREANSYITETIDGLGAFFKGKIDVQRNIAGPVRMTAMTADVMVRTNFDMSVIIRIFTLISVALGFFNLLPLPGLDGGHVLFNLIELVTRRRFPEKIRRYIEFAGVVLIISLSIFVLFNDVFNLRMGR